MSVEIISLGRFDYSDFNLSDFEKNIVSYLVKYHICSYDITINTSTQELVFYMNMTNLSQDKATTIFIDIFNLLEEQFAEKNLDKFTIYILHNSFTFCRTIIEDINPSNLVNWKIHTDDVSRLKLDLFEFYHKKQHFDSLLKKYPEKNTGQKQHKI